MFKFVGIDPGKSGAMAIIDSFDIIDIIPFDIDNYIHALIKYIDDASYSIYIEQVHAMPGQGVTSMFNFGKNYGMILGVLHGLNLRYTEVTPQKWKRKMCVTKDKKSSIIKAMELYPNANLYRTNRCKVQDNNLAEALLIAHYNMLCEV